MVYVAGGLAVLMVALDLGGGVGVVVDRAWQADKLRLFDFSGVAAPLTFVAAVIGGAMLSAASHGTDHLIVQRLLATRSLHDARLALVGSGLLVTLQFALFLAVGTAIWAAGQAPAGLAGDEVLTRFVITQLPAGVAGLVVAAILAAAMSTISSSISALASSLTNDLYASWTGRHDGAHLLRVGRWFSLLWGVLLTTAAWGFHAAAAGRDTPVVVLALAIASVTYGALLGAFVLSAPGTRVQGREVITAAAVAMVLMLVLVFASRLAVLPGLGGLAPLARIGWTWTVPLGTLATVLLAVTLAWLRALSGRRSPPA
jgi:Na+/proline symporter